MTKPSADVSAQPNPEARPFAARDERGWNFNGRWIPRAPTLEELDQWFEYDEDETFPNAQQIPSNIQDQEKDPKDR